MSRPILNKALAKAVELAGGQTALAHQINEIMGDRLTVPRKQGDVWAWLHRTGVVPTEYLVPIETAVEGAVTIRELATGKLKAAA